MLNLAPAVQYTHRADGPAIDVFQRISGATNAVDTLHGHYPDIAAITVAVHNDGREPTPVECGICFTGGLNIRYVDEDTLACVSCRVSRKLTAI